MLFKYIFKILEDHVSIILSEKFRITCELLVQILVSIHRKIKKSHRMNYEKKGVFFCKITLHHSRKILK